MPKTQQKFLISHKVIIDFGGVDYDHSSPVIFSDAYKIYESLIRYIREGSAEELGGLLTRNFIYSGDGLREGDTPEEIGQADDSYCYVATERIQWHTRGDTPVSASERRVFKYYYTRPILETLFFEYQDLFLELLSRVASSNDPTLHEVFIKAFMRCKDLPQDMLTPPTHKKLENLNAGIAEIKKYGGELLLSRVERGADAITLAHNLENTLSSDGIIPPSANRFTASVKSLKFNFKFSKQLHSLDDKFSKHRGWKHIITNIAALLCTGPIAHAIHYIAKGNLLFFNRTTTQSLISNVDEHLKNKDSLNRCVKS